MFFVKNKKILLVAFLVAAFFSGCWYGVNYIYTSYTHFFVYTHLYQSEIVRLERVLERYPEINRVSENYGEVEYDSLTSAKEIIRRKSEPYIFMEYSEGEWRENWMYEREDVYKALGDLKFNVRYENFEKEFSINLLSSVRCRKAACLISVIKYKNGALKPNKCWNTNYPGERLKCIVPLGDGWYVRYFSIPYMMGSDE